VNARLAKPIQHDLVYAADGLNMAQGLAAVQAGNMFPPPALLALSSATFSREAG
jgi:hypothetical protein